MPPCRVYSVRDSEAKPIEPREPAEGPDPYVSVGRLSDRIDGILRQPVDCRPLVDGEFRRLRQCPHRLSAGEAGTNNTGIQKLTNTRGFTWPRLRFAGRSCNRT